MNAHPYSLTLQIFLAATAGSLVVTWLVVKILERFACFDLPNARSSHSRPTPRGGGWAIWCVTVPIWALLCLRARDAMTSADLAVGFVGLLAVSWWDDCRNVPARIRLVVQILAVWFGVQSFLPNTLFFHGILPISMDHAAAGFLWLWFINLFNFMDGIDGISSTECLVICGGILAVGCVTGLVYAPWVEAAALLGGAALGFAAHNWHPARLFLGDVGSVPLGFLLGWLLLGLDISGCWQAAILLPAYYLADSTITLLRRLHRGERIWEPHRTHFYQQAAQHEGQTGGWKHNEIVWQIGILGIGLIALSIAAVLWSSWYMVPGFAAVAGLLLRFKRGNRQ